VAPVALAID
jgi:RIO-like serine/threonine protein kinase